MDELVPEFELDAAPNLSEFERQRGLREPVSLVTSVKAIQVTKDRATAGGPPIPQPNEDIVPFVDGTHIEEECCRIALASTFRWSFSSRRRSSTGEVSLCRYGATSPASLITFQNKACVPRRRLRDS